jgi:multidrug efflux system membrane fusion protein
MNARRTRTSCRVGIAHQFRALSNFWWAVPTLLFSLASHAMAAEAIPVRVQPFSELAVYPEQSAPATVVSDNHSRISAEIKALILDIPVRVGESVAKGALLAQLDPRDLELAVKRETAALAAITAKLNLAEYELNRASSLSKQQAVSEQLLQQRESERNALLAEQQGQQAASAQAQRQLDKTAIRAPFNAVIVERIAQVGELANPGTALLRIMDIDNLELAAKLSAAQTDDLRRGLNHNASPIFVSSGQRYKLTLRTITPVLDTQARTQEARLGFVDRRPLTGATGKLVWSPLQASLPTEFISQRQGVLGVFIQSGDKARFVKLEKAETGRPAVVELSPETAVITKGRYRLQDGDTISLVDTGTTTPTAASSKTSP